MLGVHRALVNCLHCRDWELNCYDNAHLQHVHVQDFVPSTFAFRSSCKVHAEWTNHLEFEHFAAWAGSNMWRDESVTLASIKICVGRPLEPSMAVQVIVMGFQIYLPDAAGQQRPANVYCSAA